MVCWETLYGIVVYGGRTKVEGCRREEWEEEFEEAIATEFGEVVAGPLRSRREMPGISRSRKIRLGNRK